MDQNDVKVITPEITELEKIKDIFYKKRLGFELKYLTLNKSRYQTVAAKSQSCTKFVSKRKYHLLGPKVIYIFRD